MSETQQNETVERQAANSGCVKRLVRPRAESPKWIQLGRHLDSILEDCDNAIHYGFVKGKTKVLDEKLGKIIFAAQEARKLLRPNAEHEPRAVASRAPCSCSAIQSKGEKA